MSEPWTAGDTARYCAQGRYLASPITEPPGIIATVPWSFTNDELAALTSPFRALAAALGELSVDRPSTARMATSPSRISGPSRVSGGRRNLATMAVQRATRVCTLSFRRGRHPARPAAADPDRSWRPGRTEPAPDAGAPTTSRVSVETSSDHSQPHQRCAPEGRPGHRFSAPQP